MMFRSSCRTSWRHFLELSARLFMWTMRRLIAPSTASTSKGLAWMRGGTTWAFGKITTCRFGSNHVLVGDIPAFFSACIRNKFAIPMHFPKSFFVEFESRQTEHLVYQFCWYTPSPVSFHAIIHPSAQSHPNYRTVFVY